MRSPLVSVSMRLRAARFCRNPFFSPSFAAIALLFAPALQAQYISYAGMQTVFPVTGVVAPVGIAIDGAGNRYIMDNSIENIIVVSASGAQSTITSTLSNPNAITVDSAGTNVYAADGNRVLKIPVNGGAQTTVGSGLSNPTGVALDSAGDVYIADNGNNRVLKVAAGGGQTEVATGTFLLPSGVAVDAYDNLFVADAGYNSLFKVTPSGTVFTIQSTTLVMPVWGVAVDKFGNIFVSSESGYLTMYAIGGLVRPVGTGWNVPLGMAGDSSGNVYVADIAAGQIAVLAPGAVDIGPANVCPSSGPQTPPCSQSVTLNYNVAASVQNISSVAVKVSIQGVENGDFTETANTCTGDFTTDTTCAITVNFAPTAPGIRLGAVDVVGIVAPPNNVVHRQQRMPQARPNFVLPPGATELSTVYVHGVGVAPIAGFDAGIISTLSNGFLSGNYLASIRTDSSGNIYAADNGKCVVYEFTPPSTTAVIAGTGSCGPEGGDGGPATGATFSRLWGIVVDPRGDLFISDPNNAVIREVDGITGIINTIAGIAGSRGHTPDGTPAIYATLTDPSGMAVDGAGNLYYADGRESLIRRIDASSGILTTVAGNYAAGAGYGGDGGLATSGQMNFPLTLAIDSAGNFYIADDSNNVIRKVDAATGIITTAAGQGPPASAGYAGDGGPATSALLNDAEGVGVDAAGNIYIADSSNLLIRKVNVHSGIITTAAGVYSGGIETYTGDGGPAILAGLSYMEDVTVDPNGNIIVADSDNSAIRKVSAASGIAAFGSFTVGSSSPAINVTLINDGNSTLNLSALAPSANFNLSGGSTSCMSSSALTPGETCILGIAFLPTTTGSLTGTITATDNVLNNATSTQSVALSGTGTAAAATQLALAGVAGTVSVGGNLGTVHVSVETSGGTVVTGSTASITVTITGPGGYSQQLTVSAVNGVATFDLSSLTFSAAGSYTITAASSGLTQASAPFTVTASVQPAILALSTLPATVAQGGNLGTLQVSVETSGGGVVVTESTASITVTITGPGGYSQQMTVSAVNGIAPFDLASFIFATLGNYTITASSSALTSAVATFIVEQNFVLTPSTGAGTTPTQTVVPGAPAVYRLQLAPAGTTFNAPIILSATGLPPGATYTFNPAIITPGAAAATTVLTVDTPAATASLRPGQNMTSGLALFLPAAFLLPWAGSRNRRHKARWFAALPLLLLGLLLGIAGLSGCGAGGLFGQPPATYTITVTGTSGALTHSTTVTLTVQ